MTFVAEVREADLVPKDQRCPRTGLLKCVPSYITTIAKNTDVIC